MIVKLFGYSKRVLSALLVLACSAAAWSVDSNERYPVNPGDTLSISVWQEPSLQGEVVVRPDGYFSFPLVGEIQASGRPVSEIESAVATKLKEFIPDAVVTVSVGSLDGYKIYVIGQVRNAGEFALNTNIDVMRALAQAGGLTEFADLRSIRILRRTDGKQQAIPFDYRDVIRGENLEQNIILQAGDVVIVP